jgi:hypothetical protein
MPEKRSAAQKEEDSFLHGRIPDILLFHYSFSSMHFLLSPVRPKTDCPAVTPGSPKFSSLKTFYSI